MQGKGEKRFHVLGEVIDGGDKENREEEDGDRDAHQEQGDDDAGLLDGGEDADQILGEEIHAGDGRKQRDEYEDGEESVQRALFLLAIGHAEGVF
ncbi:MAG TPA: hypothetical protein DCP62_10470 [Erysipelotrichaceae bacterium]|nr:hypothetical protein [Erysipelotrichaceae bacterium]